jgi:S1-C subfamily serine protease
MIRCGTTPMLACAGYYVCGQGWTRVPLKGRLMIRISAAALAMLLATPVSADNQDKTRKECELARHDPDRAIVACSRLLTRFPSSSHAAAFHNRGVAFAAKGNLDQAIADITQGIRLDPQRAYRWQERGEIYLRQGKYQQAIADLTEAIRIDPTRAFRFHHRGKAHQDSGDLARAILDFSNAIRLDPIPRVFRFHDRGNALRDAAHYDRALADYAMALQLAPSAMGHDPTSTWVLVDRGRTYAKMGRPQDAKKDFDSALALAPWDGELRHVVGTELAALANAPSPVPPAPQKTTPPKEKPLGSAFVVSREGHLLTNNHVVSGCELVAIAGYGPATVVGRDSGNDLALIRASTSGLEPLKFASKSIRLGEEVVTLGYPLRSVLGDGLNVTTGTISALSGIANDSTQLQFTAAIQPGSSGGALVNRAGAVVGVVVGRLSDTAALELGFVPQGVNFAIRKEMAIAFLESQGISPERRDAEDMIVADIAQFARNSVLPVICRK